MRPFTGSKKGDSHRRGFLNAIGSSLRFKLKKEDPWKQIISSKVSMLEKRRSLKKKS